MSRTRGIVVGAAGFGVLVTGVAVGLLVQARAVRYETRVVLREGWTVYEVAAALGAAGVVGEAEFLAACFDREFVRGLGIPADDAEGFLFPDTYRFYARTPAREVLTRLVDNFREKTGELRKGREAAIRELGAAAGEDGELAWVTLASMVEAEAVVDRERGRIAAVMWNRLVKKDPEVTRLQVDPTAVYGCRRFSGLESCRGAEGRAATRAMLDDAANPYNTYRRDALPPGPIGNPGLASLRGVLGRPETDDLFYVARGDGTHEFSRTYEEHRKAVERWR
ncbi:MAG: endolytic transglycosylase MltG [Deltaproteobacteria bacterium]|nr:endolytic transglycosylase MltG [Deltaproteobacteria bacterium]